MRIGGIGNCWYTVFIAARFLIDQEEYDDEDTDPHVLAANKHGLEVWGVRPRRTAYDQEVDESKWVLLIGKKLALIGDGGDDSVHIPPDELLKHIQET
ncbi:MAG: hypothetical protein L0241_08275, partial [Planctomycetia bacterium]|nr:hypothetical protein [Planctomycetia bacterium]